MSDDHRRSRRDLLTGWMKTVRSASTAASGTSAIDPEKVLRPPGALKPDEEFVAACTGCGDCVPVCPTSSIFTIEHSGEKKIPVINPSAKACYLCTELPCIAACKDGALIDPGGPEKVRLGIAKVDPRRCVTFKGDSCDKCYTACPYPDLAIMSIGGRPLIGSGACTGCGLCEMACPEQPKAIVVIAERNLVPGLRIPKEEQLGG
jgi:ferredoxin-type protein NapF